MAVVFLSVPLLFCCRDEETGHARCRCCRAAVTVLLSCRRTTETEDAKSLSKGEDFSDREGVPAMRDTGGGVHLPLSHRTPPPPRRNGCLGEASFKGESSINTGLRYGDDLTSSPSPESLLAGEVSSKLFGSVLRAPSGPTEHCNEGISVTQNISEVTVLLRVAPLSLEKGAQVVDSVPTIVLVFPMCSSSSSWESIWSTKHEVSPPP